MKGGDSLRKIKTNFIDDLDETLRNIDSAPPAEEGFEYKKGGKSNQLSNKVVPTSNNK